MVSIRITIELLKDALVVRLGINITNDRDIHQYPKIYDTFTRNNWDQRS